MSLRELTEPRDAGIALCRGREPILPMARLRNASNFCYANTFLQVLYWTGELSNDLPQCSGQCQALLRSLSKSKSLDAVTALTWRPFFREWAHPTRQHDIGEFAAFFLSGLGSAAFCGRWEARLAHPFTVTDSGPLAGPILLHLGGASLQALIDAWHSQHTVHALASHCGALLLQLCRYTTSSESPQKDSSRIAIQPGEVVHMPVFDSERAASVRHEPFVVGAVAVHLGNRIDSGHYRAFLCKPVPNTRPPTWHWWACDDNVPPKRGTAKDHTMLSHNAYLVGLIKTSSAVTEPATTAGLQDC